MKRIAIAFLMALNLLSTNSAQEDAAARTRKQCEQNLRRIYDAVQAYRKEHKKLPPYLNSLLPKHLEGNRTFQCPAAEGKEHPFAHLKDPKLDSDYLYEFSEAEAGHVWGGGKTTMAEMKMLQMSLVGSAVPILRCHFHQPVLNISFDGVIFESPLDWEELHQDKVDYRDLAPTRIRAKLLRTLGEAAGEEIAFEVLQDAANLGRPVAAGSNLTEEQKKSNQEVASEALVAYEKAGAFLKKFPKSPRFKEARQIQHRMLFTAARAGDPKGRDLFLEAARQAKGDPSAGREDALNLNLMALALEGSDPTDERYERAVKSLIKDFPEQIEPYQRLLWIAQEGEKGKGQRLVEEVIASENAPEEAKQIARGYLKRMNLEGNPLDLAFTAVDGREVDLARMKGKVVLIDFWATWCGPCVVELPKVQAVYDQFHDQGFEIVGISFDSNKSALEKFVAQRKMAWPQYFDGKGWKNKVGQEYVINSIPTMWLVGRDGKVADTNARENLAGKVEKLLAGQ